MTKRSPNHRRKTSRKPSPRSHAPEMLYQDAAYNQAGHQQDRQYSGMLYTNGSMPAFSEDSIQRQLGYMVPPSTLPLGHANMWQPGCWYPYTHPATGEEVAVWYDGRYAYGEEDYSYVRKHEDGCERFSHQGECYDVRHDIYLHGRKHENGCERFYHQGDCIVHHECFSSEENASPPRYRYVEGYHDPILKGLAPDWWRLFGHDVPKQFILSPKSVEEPDAGSEPRKAKEKDGEWDAAAYFGPYRASDIEPCRGPEKGYGEEEAKGRDGRELGEGSVNSTTAKKPTQGSKRECRGRDD